MNIGVQRHLESRSEIIDVRGLRYNIRHWGREEAPKLFLLHGWMDASATFQFVVDALRQSWHVIAPDWRGYGESQWLSRPYWFPDYYADLDSLLTYYSPNQPARLVGHSMGANIASTYAAVRPERVSQLGMLDFLGLKPLADIDAPIQIGNWLQGIQKQPKLRAYKNFDGLAHQLKLVNHRLSEDQAAFLARSVGRVRPDGQVEMACDPWHKIPSPTIYQIDDAMACWQKITAPVLILIAEHGFVVQRFGQDHDEYAKRIACFSQLHLKTINDAGHNLHHDQPQMVAKALEDFFVQD